MKTKDVTQIAVVAAIYFAVTMLLGSISFGVLQLRVADVFLLLCLKNKKYIYSNIMGVFLVNLFSPLGLIDIIVGVVVQAICGVVSLGVKNKWVYSTICSLIVGFGVGSEIWFVYRGAYWFGVISVVISTAIVLYAGCGCERICKTIL